MTKIMMMLMMKNMTIVIKRLMLMIMLLVREYVGDVGDNEPETKEKRCLFSKLRSSSSTKIFI